jgi:hypothetical protein
MSCGHQNSVRVCHCTQALRDKAIAFSQTRSHSNKGFPAPDPDDIRICVLNGVLFIRSSRNRYTCTGCGWSFKHGAASKHSYSTEMEILLMWIKGMCDVHSCKSIDAINCEPVHELIQTLNKEMTKYFVVCKGTEQRECFNYESLCVYRISKEYYYAVCTKCGWEIDLDQPNLLDSSECREHTARHYFQWE